MSLAFCGREAPGGLSPSSVSDIVEGAESWALQLPGAGMDMPEHGTGLGFMADTGTFSPVWLRPHVGLLFGSYWLPLLVLDRTAVPRAAPKGSAPSSGAPWA